MIKRVIIHINILDGYEEEFEKISSDMIENTRNSLGCLKYTMYINSYDIKKTCFYFEFSDAKTLHDHFFSEHKRTFMQAIKPMLADELKVQIF